MPRRREGTREDERRVEGSIRGEAALSRGSSAKCIQREWEGSRTSIEPPPQWRGRRGEEGESVLYLSIRFKEYANMPGPISRME